MPFYFLDTQNHEPIAEDEGFEFRNLEEAKVQAAGYLVDAAKGHLTPDRDRQEIVCIIKDDKKQALLRLRLVLEIVAATDGGQPI
jgi:hypothetical protein